MQIVCLRDVLGSSPGQAICAFSTDGGLCGGSMRGVQAAKGLSRRFQVDSVTNLIKQGEIVTDPPCCSVAQWSDAVREVWVRVPDGPFAFSSCDI